MTEIIIYDLEQFPTDDKYIKEAEIVYDKYFILFVLIGVLLLAALIGCLLLSYDYKYTRYTDI